MTDADRRDLFKQHVNAVVLEVSSKCNRKCWWCSNSLPDSENRTEKNIYFPMDVYERVLNELSSVEYERNVSLFNINEPLLCADLEARIAICKRILPKSEVQITTNGDYLTREKLLQMSEAGLDRLYVSIYVDSEDKEWTVESATAAVTKMRKKIDVIAEQELIAWNNYEVSATMGNVRITILCRNHRIWEKMYSRGGTLDTARWNAVLRNIPCKSPFHTFVVNYTGKVYPCCVLTDREEHDCMIIGDVFTESIFDIFSSQKAREVRKRCLFDFQNAICSRCQTII